MERLPDVDRLSSQVEAHCLKMILGKILTGECEYTHGSNEIVSGGIMNCVCWSGLARQISTGLRIYGWTHTSFLVYLPTLAGVPGKMRG
jgi:hypothetical protein